MTFLPIVERELRVASRRRGTYWMRSLVALLATVLGVFLYAASVRLPQRLVAQYTFLGLSVLALIYCLLSGRRFTADCLSGEKREGTLGLLFLTDLKGYDVVFGKLAATSLRGFYGLLAVFPVLAIPLLLGGITKGEFWRVVLVLVNTFLFSLAIGIFVSALCRDARRAFAGNFFVLLLLAAGPPAIAGAIMFSSSSAPAPIPELLYSCPVYFFYLYLDDHYKIDYDHFWWSIAVTQGLTWLLLLLAAWLVPYSWQDRASGLSKIRWRDRWHVWNYGDAAQRKTFRKRLLDLNAFYWLAARARLKPAQVWIFLVFMAGWWLYVWLKTERNMLNESLILTALILNSSLKTWIAIEAAQRLAEDQTAGALELLLSTPLTVRDILHGQILALRRQFLKPLFVAVVVELIFMWIIVRRGSPDGHRMLKTWLAGIFILLADVLALIWVAMVAGLSARSPNQAIISAIFRILLLPWVAFGGIAILDNLRCALMSLPDPGWEFYLNLWFWSSFCTDVAFGLVAWRRLNTRFRELARQRFNSRPGRFSSWASGRAGQ